MSNVVGMTRSLAYKHREGNRYWWFRVTDANYIPPVFAALAEREWDILDQWYADSERAFGEGTGECAVPAISFLSGLIGGNNISRVVQLGHYAGFSALMMGFQLRAMSRHHRLVSIDIDPAVTQYCQEWIDTAGLQDHVKLVVSDSAALDAPGKARALLGDNPELIFLDSSHQYAHTIRELDVWYDNLAPGGIIVLHDASEYAASFDGTGPGVLAALRDWSARRGVPHFAFNHFVTGAPDEPRPVYKDGCGLGLVQRPVR